MSQNKYSDFKIVNFPGKIKSFQEGRIADPICVRIKPINRCSHACRWCVYSDGTKRKGDIPGQHMQAHMHENMQEADMMPKEKALELIASLGEIGVKSVIFSGGGEPLMHPNIIEIFQRTKEAEIDFAIITNGQSLSGARAKMLTMAKWVRVSIDYTSPQQMQESRSVKESFFDGVMQNLHAFASIKSPSCDLGVNFIVTKANHQDLISFSKTLKLIGVENIRFSPVYVDGFMEYHAPIKDRVEEQLRELQSICDENFTINTTYDLDSPSKKKERPFKKCLYSQTVPVVGADLGVYACHNTAYSKHGRIGDIKGKTFKDMWFSEETAKWFSEFDPSCVCHHECANQKKVVLFNALAEGGSDNFV